MNSVSEETVTTAPAPAPKGPKPTKKGSGAKRAGHVASARARSGRKASPAKKTPKAANQASPVRDGSKTSAVMALLRSKDGATLKQLVKATGWQPHSVRGFLSGTVGKKMGLPVTSAKGEDGERVYSIS